MNNSNIIRLVCTIKLRFKASRHPRAHVGEQMENSITHSELVMTGGKLPKQTHKYDDISVTDHQALIIYSVAKRIVLHGGFFFYLFFPEDLVNPAVSRPVVSGCVCGGTKVHIPIILSLGKSSYINHRQTSTPLSH